MKISIRYLGILVVEKDLESGTYKIGRAPDNEIQLTQEFVSRHHGRLYQENQAWYYEDLRKDHEDKLAKPVKIESKTRIDLGPGLQLVMEDNLWEEKTEVASLQELPKLVEELGESKKTIQWLTRALTIIVSVLMAGTFYWFWKSPKSTNSLLAMVRPKIVEFQHHRNPKLMEQLKSYANLQDADLRETAGFCSGFLVSTNVVMTAFHCLQGQSPVELNTDVEVKTYKNEILKVVRVLGFDIKRDYLLFEVRGAEPLGYLELDTNFSIGEKVYTIGNVEGEGIAIREGITASTTVDPNDPTVEYIRYSAAASPGNSGGPLVTNQGKVLGLVFAKSLAENYNVATASNHLNSGIKLFAKNTTPKEIEFELSSLPDIVTQDLLADLGYPWLTTWEDQPEDIRPFEKMKAKVTVPQELHALGDEFSSQLNESIHTTYQEILQDMKAADREEGTWLSIPSAESNIFYLPDFFDATEYKSVDHKIIPLESKVSMAPSKRFLKEYVKALKEGEYIPLEGDSLMGLVEDSDNISDLVYASETTGKKSLTMLSLEMDFLTLQSFADSRPKIELGDKKFAALLRERVLGKGGVLFETTHIPFVRPKNQRQFTVTRLLEDPTEIQITDAYDRTWHVYKWQILSRNLLSFCLPVVSGAACLNTVSDIQDEHNVELFQKNFAKNALTEIYFHQPYVNPALILDSKNKSMRSSQVLRDVLVDKSGDGSYNFKFKTLNTRFQIPAKLRPSQIRVLGGLLREKNAKEAKWVALGLDVIARDRQDTLGCSMAVELKSAELRHPAFKAYERQAQRMKTSSTKNDPVRFTEHYFDAIHTKGKIWTFCTPVQVNSEDARVNWNVQRKKPFLLNYRILN